jgi:DNA invertase Pin-like site-specific DNA recombinase
MFKEAIIAILGTIAEQERVRICQRVRAGLARAKEKGTRSGRPIGRPRAVFSRDQVQALRDQGLSWQEIARRTGTSVGSVRRAYRTVSGVSGLCQKPGEAEL